MKNLTQALVDTLRSHPFIIMLAIVVTLAVPGVVKALAILETLKG